MSAETKTSRKGGFALGGGALLMILGCAVGPAIIGAAAGSAIGGWLGIASAVIVATAVGLVPHRRNKDKAC